MNISIKRMTEIIKENQLIICFSILFQYLWIYHTSSQISILKVCKLEKSFKRIILVHLEYEKFITGLDR